MLSLAPLCILELFESFKDTLTVEEEEETMHHEKEREVFPEDLGHYVEK